MKPVFLAVCAVVVLGGLVLSGCLSSGAPAAQGAAQPTPPTRFVSPTGDDTASCTRNAPCLSLDRAYDVARPGEVVEIADGTYGEQLITGTKAAPCVKLQPAKGAHVTLQYLRVDADRLEVRDLAIATDLGVYSESDFATLRNMNLGARLYIAGPRDLKIIGGDVGPFVDGPSWVTAENGKVPQRVLIQGVHFHDFTISAPGMHSECMLVIAGDGLTFRGNRFTRCSIYDLSFGYCCDSPAPPTNVIVENNFFAAGVSDAATSLHMNGNLPAVNYVIRNNSATGPMVLDGGQATFVNIKVIGNAMPIGQWGCGRAIFEYNVFTGSRCPGKRNKLARDLGFANAAAGDYHLKQTSPAREAGSPVSYPSLDIDGQKRPMGKKPDAGADERFVKVVKKKK